MIKQNVRYDVIAQPSPEYLEGKPGRNGIYTVVKLVDDLPPEIVKVFDGHPSSQSREDAYAHARELNERRRQELETAVLIPFIEDLKALSIADASEVDRLRTENEALKARIKLIQQRFDRYCRDGLELGGFIHLPLQYPEAQCLLFDSLYKAIKDD